MTAAHFQNLPAELSRCLARAERHLQIAVCWFSHRDLFGILLEKLRAGVQVDLLIEYDSRTSATGRFTAGTRARGGVGAVSGIGVKGGAGGAGLTRRGRFQNLNPGILTPCTSQTLSS